MRLSGGLLHLLTAALASADELCSTGVIGQLTHAEAPWSSAVLASVCCPASCGRCGGVDCWSQDGGMDCCARHVFDSGRQCEEVTDTACVLPEPTTLVMPATQREKACLDLWSAAYPGEKEVRSSATTAARHAAPPSPPSEAQGCARVRQDWSKRSCKFKVDWEQCSTFYAPCQCSCGYCAPTRASCDPRASAPAGAHLPPPAPRPPPLLAGGSEEPRLVKQPAWSRPPEQVLPPDQMQQLAPTRGSWPPAPPMRQAGAGAAGAPTGVTGTADAAASTAGAAADAPHPSMAWLAPLAAWVGGALADGLGLHFEQAVLQPLLLALLLSCCVPVPVGLLFVLCQCASRPDAPAWMRRCTCVGDRGAYAVVGVDTAAPPPVECAPSVLSARSTHERAASAAAGGASAVSAARGPGRGRGRGRGRGGAAARGGGRHGATTAPKAAAATVRNGSACGGGRGGAHGPPANGAEGAGGDGATTLDDDDDDDDDDDATLDGLAEYVDDIGPDDSVSVAWMSADEKRAVREETQQLGAGVPVTIEGPDGSRHAIQVDLRGIASSAELLQGMLQGYRELLEIDIPDGAIRVQARLATGASLLLADTTPLSERLLGAVSFYVWAALDDEQPGDAETYT